MVIVQFSRRALDGIEGAFEFLAASNPAVATPAADHVIRATAMLAEHPLIGRPAGSNLRELVISYGQTGFVALYRFRPRARRVEVLAIRHQRQAGRG